VEAFPLENRDPGTLENAPIFFATVAKYSENIAALELRALHDVEAGFHRLGFFGSNSAFEAAEISGEQKIDPPQSRFVDAVYTVALWKIGKVP